MELRQASRGKGFNDPRYRAVITALSEERKRQGLSQQKLADKLNRHQQFVSRYESGERRLDVVEFIDVARALNMELPPLIASVPHEKES